MPNATPRVDYEDVLPFTASGTIPQFAVVYQTGVNTVAVATSPEHQPLVGVALHAKTDGQHIDVARFETVINAIADGAIAVNQLVRPSSTSGRVTGVSPATGAPGAVIGVALSAAGAAGEHIMLLIAPELGSALGSFRVFTAQGAITAGRIVKAGSSNNTVAQNATASPTLTGPLFGVALNTAADGAPVCVALGGSVAPATSGAAFSRGVFITSDSAGKAIVAAPGGGTNCATIGFSLAAAGGADESVNILLSPGAVQG